MTVAGVLAFMTSQTPTRAPVTLAALWKRLTRRVQREHGPGRYLAKPRSARARAEFGVFMLVHDNCIIDSGPPERLEYLARELGCLGEWEYLVS